MTATAPGKVWTLRRPTGPLWHFTSWHTFEAIGEGGTLVPGKLLWSPDLRHLYPPPEYHILGEVVWLTDLAEPPPLALGLDRPGSELEYSRLAYRYRADDTSNAIWWPDFMRDRRLSRVQRSVCFSEGALPAHWWVAPTSIDVVYDPQEP
jgi:hypothetical protein